MRSFPQDKIPDKKDSIPTGSIKQRGENKSRQPKAEEVDDEYDISEDIRRLNLAPDLKKMRAKAKVQDPDDHDSDSSFHTEDESSDDDGEGNLDTLQVDMDAFIESIDEFVKGDEPFDEEEKFDYTDPYFRLGLDDLNTLVLNDIAKNTGSGIPQRQYRRLQDFLELTTENGRPKDDRAAAKLLTLITFFKGKKFDCCRDSCMSFARYPKLRHCPYCKKARYLQGGRKPAAQYTVFQLEHRLRLHYSNPVMARIYKNYRAHAERTLIDSGRITDYWSGKIHSTLQKERGLFKNPTDIALSFSTDGAKAFKTRSSFHIWPGLFQVLNLPPEMRVKRCNLLLGLIIPEPNNPRNIDSFLVPVVDELVRLEAGVSNAYDADSKRHFQLHAYNTVVCTDMQARPSLIHSTGPQSISMCEYCYIKGIKSGGVYAPHTCPEDLPPWEKHRLDKSRQEGKACYDFSVGDKFQTSNPPRKTDSGWRSVAADIEKLKDEENIKSLSRQHGIRGRSEFARLKAIIFPWSFPPCGMHLFHENCTPKLTRHYMGTFGEKKKDPDSVAKPDAPTKGKVNDKEPNYNQSIKKAIRISKIERPGKEKLDKEHGTSTDLTTNRGQKSSTKSKEVVSRKEKPVAPRKRKCSGDVDMVVSPTFSPPNINPTRDLRGGAEPRKRTARIATSDMDYSDNSQKRKRQDPSSSDVDITDAGATTASTLSVIVLKMPSGKTGQTNTTDIDRSDLSPTMVSNDEKWDDLAMTDSIAEQTTELKTPGQKKTVPQRTTPKSAKAFKVTKPKRQLRVDTKTSARLKIPKKRRKKADVSKTKFRDRDDPYNIKPEQWEMIGKDTLASSQWFPTSFGDNIKDFTKRCHDLKAANWSRWALTECLIHLKDRLDDFHYRELVNYVRAVQMAMQHEFTLDELQELYTRIMRFSK